MIRKANKFDVPNIFPLLYKFRDEYQTTVSEFNNEQHAALVLTTCIHGGGLLYVAEKDDKIVGFIAGMRSSVVWDPNTFVLNEIAFFVDKDYRNEQIGKELLKEYLLEAIDMKQNGIIHNYTMVMLEGTPNLHLEKFNMVKQETIYVGEA